MLNIIFDSVEKPGQKKIIVGIKEPYLGNLLIPKNTTLPKYLDSKVKHVKRCDLDYYNQAQPIYFNYKYINGHWVFINQSTNCE